MYQVINGGYSDRMGFGYDGKTGNLRFYANSDSGFADYNLVKNTDLAIQNITSQITVTSAVTTGDINVFRYGKLVQVRFWSVDTNPTIGEFILVATGLPKPVLYGNVVLEYGGQVLGSAYIDPGSSNLYVHHTVAGLFVASMFYLTNDF